jgi:hypothetical protein
MASSLNDTKFRLRNKEEEASVLKRELDGTSLNARALKSDYSNLNNEVGELNRHIEVLNGHNYEVGFNV